MSTPKQPYKPKLTTTTPPPTFIKTLLSADTAITTVITFIFNTVISSTIILQILQTAQNSVYPTIFILIHNLIPYTTLCTYYLKSDKNTITMAKYPHKLLENQSNRRSIIHCHIKLKRPKKLQQQSSQNIEATKVNAIMEKLEKSDGDGCRSKNNINNFAPIYESGDE